MRPEDSSPALPRRRSARLSTPEQKPVERRTFNVRKIVPRKTQVPEALKENVERLSMVNEKSPRKQTPSSTKSPSCRRPVLSPIQPDQSSSPPPTAKDQTEDEVWSQKVRRSYSRLSENSFGSPGQQNSSSPLVGGRRESLFGFERMPTPKVKRPLSALAPTPQASSSMVGATLTGGSLNLSEAEESCNLPEPDPNIPGVPVPKKQSKKKRVQPIKVSELDELAAQMNAEFAEAESFELVVE